MSSDRKRAAYAREVRSSNSASVSLPSEKDSRRSLAVASRSASEARTDGRWRSGSGVPSSMVTSLVLHYLYAG